MPSIIPFLDDCSGLTTGMWVYISNLIQLGTIPPMPSVLFCVKQFVMVPLWHNYKHVDI